jgi:hypothetical protein
MAVQTKDLWRLVKGRPQVDPHDLADAIEEQVGQEPLDYRTRLLVRDSVEALRNYWGSPRLTDWLAQTERRDQIEAICCESFEEIGFPTLARRLMDKTDPEDIRQFLREVGVQLSRPLKVFIGGSAALILPGHLARATDDIDVVDEVPSEIRTQYRLLDQLKARFGLEMRHFQSHFLPQDWEKRVHSLAPFGKIQAYLVDPYDVLLSKLFSARDKDRDDLRIALQQLDKAALVRKLKEHCAALLAVPDLRQKAEKNWYILFGESLPS